VTERCDWNESLHVEAMVRAAGHYVRASDDLRPRVLEEARLHWGERRAQRCVRHVAMFVLLLAFFTAASPCGSDDQRLRPNSMLASAGFDELLMPTAAPTTRSGDGDWRMIEAFTELRRQQAQVLRFAL
jgi:hypothetical protein